jgi:hypothetical protein
MQVGTTNAKADCQGYINDTLWEALDDFASAYLYDVLIYSNSETEHVGLSITTRVLGRVLPFML